MKRTTFVLACVMAACFFCSSGVARAQDQWSVIQALQTQLKADRQAVVAANLPLTDGESKIFWPVYKEYRAEVEQIGDRVAKLVVAYAANFDTMNDTKAEAFFKEQMEIDRARVALREKWVPRVRKVLPTLKAARFFQIENKIDAIVMLTLASEIPLVPVKK